jgi:serine/threonine-protein kinase
MADKGAAAARLSKLGRYEVLSELGKGAMGIVYLAKDPVIGRMVAIKTIRASSMGDDDSESREFRERFIREAQTAGILSHPNIVTIHDIGEDADSQISFIAMEYIEGRNLKTLLAEKTAFSYDQIADIIAQVAEAIDYAHRKGIIHRDIKPANIIITTDQKVKITDFGIAKVASSNLTTTGQFLGTPNYMSPEQVSGAPVDGRSDIFSLGVVLYELLTKRKPFVGENLTAISYKIVHEDFTPPAELSPEVPPEFNPIVARAMAKDPWNRYQRGKDFALALHQLRAHLEEQKALADLGTIVSEAEFIPTLRLTNLEQLVAEGALEARSTEVLPPPPISSAPDEKPVAGDAATAAPSASLSPPAPEAPAVFGPAEPPVQPELAAADAQSGNATIPSSSPTARSARARTRPVPVPGPETSSPRPFPPPAAPVSPTGPHAPGTARGALARRWTDTLGFLRSRNWRALGKSEVNPQWVWRVIGAAVLFWAVILGALIARRVAVSRPTVPFDKQLAEETQQRKATLDEGRRLFAAGRYEDSLARFRKVLSRSPNNQEARQYAQMAETALEGQQAETRKRAEADRAFELARAAFAEGNYDEARRQADQTLALDGGRVDAQKLREEASARIEETAAVAARRKVASARPTPPSRRAAASPAESRAAASTGTRAPAASSGSVAGNGMLRLLFNSPITEGNVMVAVNDQILLRRQFSFKRRAGLFKTVKGTGTVDESIPVRSGPVNVKVWLSGPDIPASILATTNGQVGGGQTRVLRLDYAGGQLSAQIQ